MKIFPPDTKAVVARVDTLRKVEGKTIVVATAPRSGTHLMIDLLLNHFKRYRRNPLYVNWDQLSPLENKDDIEILSQGQIIKTHYPFWEEDGKITQQLRSLLKLKSVKVIYVKRDSSATLRSQNEMFSHNQTAVEFEDRQRVFEDFWMKSNPFVVTFEQFLGKDEFINLIRAISIYLDEGASEHIKFPVAKDQRLLAYFYKLTTRVLGAYSPQISTGIRLSK